MLKRALFTVVAIFLVLIIVFTVGEICFRLFRRESNPLAEIIQEKKTSLFPPNIVKDLHSSVKGEFDYTAHINQFGYRGENFDRTKTPGRIRIFAVGDSFTFGVGSQDNQTIPYLIEQKLRSQKFDVEVVNAGIGHASPIRHYVNLRDIHLQYEPDLVLLFFDLTDLWDDWNAEHHALYDSKGEIKSFHPLFVDGKRDWWMTCVYYSAFCRYINNKMVRTFKKMHTLGFWNYMKAAVQGKRAKALIANSKSVDAKTTMEYDALVLMRGREKEELIRAHWPRTVKYLLKIKAMLDERHIPFVMVMYPHGIYVGKSQWDEGRTTWGFEKDKQYTDYFPFELGASFAKENQIPLINTLDSFLKADPGKKYFFDWDGHMTPEANKIVAEKIAKDPAVQKILKQLEKK